MIDNVTDRIQAFLHGEVNFVVHGTKVVSHFLRGFQIRGAFQTDGEGVQLRPPGFGALLIFHAAGGVFFGDRRDNRRVQTAREQHAVRHV